MNPKNVNLSGLEVVPAAEVAPPLLDALYDEVFLHRSPFLKKHWRWYYRSAFFDQQIPLVLRGKDRAIGASGMIPVKVKMGSEIKTASWYIDFAVTEDFQRKGLGTILTKKWMSFADMQITFCNERSIGVFLKLGWTESFQTYLHVNILKPFSIPQLASKLPGMVSGFMDLIALPFVKFTYRRFAAPGSDWDVQALNEQNLTKFVKAYQAGKTEAENTCEVLRDADFINWRLLQSPDRASYRIFHIPGIQAVFAEKSNNGKYLDILWISDLSDPKLVKRLIASLSLYGLKNGATYLRFYTSSRDLSAFCKKDIPGKVRNVRFAYFSKNEALYAKMKTVNWNWQLIDSDFENYEVV
ncbi:MAG: hypothetical protein KDC34_03580 [Saprospiraceae bacterium]|nr:hypothetical protein [Saprospiraceae bacterium]